MTPPVRLTQYSSGAGCGCKIAPKVLDEILAGTGDAAPPDTRLLIGNDLRDDAAAWLLDDGETVLLATTDFFMPIVDDPFDFGRIAAANAISDIYAMGGRPVLALAVLGWPIDKLPPEVAREVIRGARTVCAEASITLAGGHSIDSPEPIFGLAVNGLVKRAHLKANAGRPPRRSALSHQTPRRRHPRHRRKKGPASPRGRRQGRRLDDPPQFDRREVRPAGVRPRDDRRHRLRSVRPPAGNVPRQRGFRRT